MQAGSLIIGTAWLMGALWGQSLEKPCRGEQQGTVWLKYPATLERYIHPIPRSKPNLPGYRVQLLATTRRSEAMDLRHYLLEHYPEWPVYLIYQQPYFKIRVGDFRSRMEAISLWPQLKADTLIARNGFFVVPDRIEWPPLP